MNIGHVFFVACQLDSTDPRKALAIAFKNVYSNVSYVKCIRHTDHSSPARNTDDIPYKYVSHTYKCSCRDCHMRIWKHIYKNYYNDMVISNETPWFLIVDLSIMTIKDTLELRSWLDKIPLKRLQEQKISTVFYNDSCSVYLCTVHGAIGLSMVARNRHPEDYNRFLKSAIISDPPFSLLALSLDILGFENLVSTLSTSLVQMTITNSVTIDLNFFHVLAFIILLTNRLYLKNNVIDALSIVEILMLSIPKESK